MIQIIIIFAIMQLGFNLLFKSKYNQMSCGLFGAAAGDVNDINIDKLKILGIFNDTRGGHSCGLSIDGDIIIGTYKNKLFKDDFLIFKSNGIVYGIKIGIELLYIEANVVKLHLPSQIGRCGGSRNIETTR